MRDIGSINPASVAEVLHYGAVINGPFAPPELPFERRTVEAARAQRARPASDRAALLAQGSALWRDVCQRVVERSQHPLLVPLSAGLDSRAVLAGLRACGAPVHAVTYGVPGAFDYELAPRIAHAAGASIDRIDLRHATWHRADLLDIAAKAPRPSQLLDMYCNQLISQQYGAGYSYANGWIGDALAGKNLDAAGGLSWQDAKQQFAVWHRVSRTVDLLRSDMEPETALPDQPLIDPALMPCIEQLDYAIRQQCLVRPIVCPPDVEVFTPFTDPEWVVFMLGLPDAQRRDRAFFVEIFQSAFPDLFALPTTASSGLPLGASQRRMRRYRRRLKRVRRLKRRLQRVFPGVHVPPADRRWQYVDFSALLRGDHPLTRLFADSMARLDDSAIVPWVDATRLLDAHRAGEADHFKALNVLLNLDIVREARPELLRAPD